MTDLEEYTLGLLADFNMQDCKPVPTPINHSSLPLMAIMSPLTDADKDYLTRCPFRSIIGSILYFLYCFLLGY
jgi:hypothetical protein